MALFKIDKLLTIGGSDKHEWTSFEVYADADMTDLIDSIYESEVNLMEWTTPLILGDGSYYNGDTFVYGRVQIKYAGRISVWIRVNPCGIEGSTPCVGFPLPFPTKLPCNEFDRFKEFDKQY
jgi:hypothetical protein